ncbi:hypothetical protein D3C74_412780 [compost metagenome]
MQSLSYKRQSFCCRLHAVQGSIANIPVTVTQGLFEFGTIQFATTLNKFFGVGTMFNRLLDDLLQSFWRIGRFQLLLNFACDVRQFAVTNAVITQFTFFDHGCTGNFGNGFDKTI